jgi:hypothetical protein
MHEKSFVRIVGIESDQRDRLVLGKLQALIQEGRKRQFAREDGVDSGGQDDENTMEAMKNLTKELPKELTKSLATNLNESDNSFVDSAICRCDL